MCAHIKMHVSKYIKMHVCSYIKMLGRIPMDVGNIDKSMLKHLQAELLCNHVEFPPHLGSLLHVDQGQLKLVLYLTQSFGSLARIRCLYMQENIKCCIIEFLHEARNNSRRH